ncbi:MAG: tyrosine-type recombinase/integrase, partial [bacterium]
LKAVRPFRRVDRPRIRHFDAEEITLLLNACEPDFRALVSGALLTGCRYGELIAMDVGQYAVGSHVRILDSKSGDARVVYLNEEGAAFFDALTAGRRADEPLFRRSDGGRWARSHQARRMVDAARVSRIPPPNNFHVLRHTYASLYLMGGGSLEGLAKQLGHADTRMTLRSYAHLAEAWRAKEAKAHAPRFGLAIAEGPVRIASWRGELHR